MSYFGHLVSGTSSVAEVAGAGLPNGQLMARRVVVLVVDDLDGGAADETVEFGLDGVEYRIDLSTGNAARLRFALAEFIRHARRTGNAHRRPAAAQTAAAEQERNRRIRSWAREAGLVVLERGRIPAEVTARFRAAQADGRGRRGAWGPDR